MRRFLLTAVILGLAGCAPQRIEDRLLACPQLSLPADVADLTRHAPGAPPDLSTLVLDARVVRVDAPCRRGRGDRTVDVSVALTVRAERGPAAAGRVAQIPWFVAVLDGEQVLSRQSFVLPVAFSPNSTRAEVTTQAVAVAFPVREGRRIQDMRLMTGLLLTEEEVALNRRRGPR